MKKIILFLMLGIIGIITISCNNGFSMQNETNEALDHESLAASSVTINKLGHSFEITGDYSIEQRHFINEIAQDIDTKLCINDGDSFIIVFEDNPARYCSDGHDFYSTQFKFLSQHTVKQGNDYWLCYIYVSTYKCKKCDYYTSVNVHTINH